jgi:hypothetical protein
MNIHAFHNEGREMKNQNPTQNPKAQAAEQSQTLLGTESSQIGRGLGAVIFVAVAVALRIVPHLPNFTPIAAMALFGGAHFRRPLWAVVLPLLTMFCSDLVIGFHSLMPAVYASFVLVALIGLALKKHKSPLAITSAALSGSVLFFMITNFAFWLQGGAGGVTYTKDLTGLIECYTAAVPFFRYEALGDLFYTATMFGLWAFFARVFQTLREAQAGLKARL